MLGAPCQVQGHPQPLCSSPGVPGATGHTPYTCVLPTTTPRSSAATKATRRRLGRHQGHLAETAILAVPWALGSLALDFAQAGNSTKHTQAQPAQLVGQGRGGGGGGKSAVGIHALVFVL